jgi:hypothetical protein
LKKQWQATKAVRLLEVGINTAAAIMMGFAQLGPVGGAIYAGVIGAAGIAQAAVIANQSAPFQTGTGEDSYIVPPGFEGDNFPVMAQSGERVTVETESEMGASDRPINITLMIDNQVLGRVILDGTQDGTIQIDERSLVTS